MQAAPTFPYEENSFIYEGTVLYGQGSIISDKGGTGAMVVSGRNFPLRSDFLFKIGRSK